MEQPIESKAIDTILQEGVDFSVSILKRTIFHKIGLLKSQRKFVILPICLGTLLKISRLLVGINENPTEIKQNTPNADFIGLGVDSIVKSKDKMVEVIALAIVNSEKDPPRKLIRFLNKNLTSKEALRLLTLVVNQMDIKSFLAFMVSVGAMSLLTSEPTSGKSSAELSNTSGSPKKKSSGKKAGPTS